MESTCLKANSMGVSLSTCISFSSSPLPSQFPYLTFLPVSDNAMHTVHPGV